LSKESKPPLINELKTMNSFPKIKLQLAGIIILLSIILLFSGYYYYQQEKQHHKKEKYNELAAVGKLKADQISNWLSERMSEATFFSTSTPYPQYIGSMVSGDKESERLYKSILSRIMSDNRYQNIYILDTNADLVFSYYPGFNQVDPVTKGFASEVFTTGNIVIQDFYYCHTHNKIHFEIFAPVRDENQNIIASVVFRINPNDYLYPLISTNPTPNRSEESYLVKQDGDSVLFLSPLRYMDNSMLQVKTPLDKADITAVSAIEGQEGIREGVDYRNEKVFSDIRKISGREWYIITEIDRKELYAKLNTLSVWLYSVIALIILLIASVVSWIYHRRQRDNLQELLEKRTKLYQAQEEYGATLYSIGDGVITTDQAGNVKHLNPVAEKLTGWKEAEARGNSIEEVFNIINEDTRLTVENPVGKVLKEGRIVGLANHTLLISRDGHETPIADSGSPIKDKKGNILGVILVFNDQTEERLHRKLIEIRLKLFEFAIDHGLEETLTKMLDEIGVLMKSPIGFFHLLLPDEEKLWLPAWSTITQKEFCKVENDSMHYDLNDAGVWADAVRQKKPVIHNNYETLANKNGMPEGHGKITRDLIVPVIRGNKVVGVMGIANKPTDFTEKDVEILSFLADVSWEIAEHKLNENRLRQSKERFIQLFEKAPLGYQSLDENGNFLEINEAWSETLGYSKKEVAGKWFGDFMHQDEVESFRKRFSNFKKNGKSHAEILMKHKNGTTRLIEFEGNIGYKDDGKFEKTHCILRDITESKQLEEQLKENERQLSSMVGNLPGFVYRCKNDKDWTMLYLSGQCKEITGFESDNFIQNAKLSYNDIIKEEYQEEIRRKWGIAIANKSSFRGEYEILTASGKEKWVLEQGIGVYDKSGELLFLEGYIEDINERKNTEIQLKESEEKFRHMFHGHAAAKIIVDPKDGNIFDANDAASEFYGWGIEELKELNITQIYIHPVKEIKENLKAAANQKSVRFEFKNRKADGEIVEVEIFGSTVKIGGKIYLHFIIHDITEKKKAEKRLFESEEKNRLIMDNSMDAILLTKPDGTIHSANKAACMMFGMTEEEICRAGRSGLVDLNDPRLPELLLQREKQGYAEGELNFIRKNGTIFTSEISTSLFTDSKGEIFSSMIIRDITERKIWEQELLIAKEKAEENDRLKSAFLANMSHEIRTPMNGILGFLNLMDSNDLGDTERTNYIRLVNLSGQRLLDTINDIIEISKIEAGEQKVKVAQTDISEIMDYHATFFKLQANQKGIELSVAEQISKEKSLVETDKNKVESILSNLVKNAIKFTEEGSIRLGNYIKDDWLVFYVKDTGRGIPAEKIDSVFERFVQADTRLTRAHEGSGLGLTISKAYVRLLGGEIWVESEAGKGSTFYFSIPYKFEHGKTASLESQNMQHDTYLKEPTVLIAEDDDASFQYLNILLKKKNIKTLRAINGMEAIQIFQENPGISLILMDVKMREMDGIEATMEIRKHNKKIPIIAQTAYAFSQDEEKVKKAGCNDFISKPIKSSALYSVLEKYLT
jgi:PAS domain S-box-containing protein